MINVAKPTTKRLLTIHGWSGVLLGLALYIVVFTGAIVVFSHEIGQWSVSGHKIDSVLVGQVDSKLSALSRQVDADYLDEVAIWQNSAGYLIAFFHTHVQNDKGIMTEKGTRFVLKPETLDVMSRADGYEEDLPAVQSSFLEDFFVDLHIRLHAPDPIGLYLTGILGLVLLMLAVSGIILHRHLIKDMFVAPRLSTSLLNMRDRHNLAGTWGIIFSIILAFTGAFFSFATTLSLPVIAITAFEGDQQKAISVLYGEPAVINATPQAFVGLETIIKQVQKADVVGSIPLYVLVEHWGRADAKVTTMHNPSDDTLFFSNHVFDGVSGRYLGEKPGIGTVPSLGNTLMGLMGVLHFGWFAGLFSKIVWLSLGLATCYVTLSGLELWVQRRATQPLWQYFGRWITIVGYGTPLAMIFTMLGFLLAYSKAPELIEDWTINSFLIGALFSIVLGLVIKGKSLRRMYFQWVLGLSLICLPLLRNVTTDQTWADLISTNNISVVALDITFLIAGIVFLYLGSGLKKTAIFEKEKGSLTSKVIHE